VTNTEDIQKRKSKINGKKREEKEKKGKRKEAVT